MAWKITIEDKSLLLDDLSQEDFMAVAVNYPETNWLRLYMAPGSHPGALYDLIVACARKMQVAAPDRPATVKDSIKLLAHLEQVEDDLPKAFDEAGVPKEATEADQEMTTSSTSTVPVAGPQNKHEARR